MKHPQRPIVLSLFVLLGAALSGWTAATPLHAEPSAQAVRSTNLIRLEYATFDPLQRPPLSAPLLAARADSELWLVQLAARPLESHHRALAASGARIITFVPDQAYVVRMNAAARTAVEALGFVRWVGPYHPAYRTEPLVRDALLLAPEALGPTGVYNLLLCERDPLQKRAVAEAVRALGGRVQNADAGARLQVVELSPAALVQMLRRDDVLFIDRWGPPEYDMDIAREISGGDYFHNTLGLTGIGVRGEVMDNGFRRTHDDFIPEPLVHGLAPEVDEDCTPPFILCPHGTSTYGIVFGDGVNCQQGLLPDGTGIVATYLGLPNRYQHTGELVDPALDWQAVFQSNSWGSTRTTQYTAVSADMDEALFDHDLLVFQSQSNAGNQNSRPESWCKNIVSVGGIRHDDTLSTDDDSWTNGASIGPASDGRIKPDLAHFYDFTSTTTSGSDTACTGGFGGTSGATPITAGHGGLWLQYWHTGALGNPTGSSVFESRPHMTLSKAMLIASADQWTFNGEAHDLTRVHQGWGRVNVRNVVDSAGKVFWVDESDVLPPLATRTWELTVQPGEAALRAVLTWADPPGNPAVQAQHRINNLDLRVTAPGGTFYWGNQGLLGAMWSTAGGLANDVDTVECVFVQDPEPGTWLVQVIADEVNMDGHVETPVLDVDYSLVVLGVINTIWVDFAYVGPETGSFTQPYNTLAEAVAAALQGGYVKIKAGTSAETLTLSKPMTIESSGGSAVIGE